MTSYKDGVMKTADKLDFFAVRTFSEFAGWLEYLLSCHNTNVSRIAPRDAREI
jgi:mannitol-1-phosphate/altronate dehydrogenase